MNHFNCRKEERRVVRKDSSASESDERTKRKRKPSSDETKQRKRHSSGEEPKRKRQSSVEDPKRKQQSNVEGKTAKAIEESKDEVISETATDGKTKKVHFLCNFFICHILISRIFL